jgi:hypothetical protein
MKPRDPWLLVIIRSLWDEQRHIISQCLKHIITYTYSYRVTTSVKENSYQCRPIQYLKWGSEISHSTVIDIYDSVIELILPT